jgi:hypothetical protein
VRRYILNRLEEADDRGLSICLGALDNELLRQGKGRAHRFPFTDVFGPLGLRLLCEEATRCQTITAR